LKVIGGAQQQGQQAINQGQQLAGQGQAAIGQGQAALGGFQSKAFDVSNYYIKLKSY